MIRVFCSALALAALAPLAATSAEGDWPMFGQSIQNSANAGAEHRISPATASSLTQKWVATLGGYVSARAAVVDGAVFVPDSAGNVWALDAKSGAVKWTVNLRAFGFPSGTYSRTSPAVDDKTVYVGTQLNAGSTARPAGAYLLALDADHGSLKWATPMSATPTSILTTAPVVHEGVVYQGVASLEEGIAANPSFACCSFRGSMAAVDAGSGAIRWQTYTVPVGYSGGAIWGSHAALDPDRNTLFIGTGNNYSTPTDPAYLSCVAGGRSGPSCLSPDDHVDSILALDMATGAIKWSHRVASQDDWNVACFYGPPGYNNCPSPEGPDYDFGSAPQEFSYIDHSGNKVTLVGAGQKSGVYSAWDADTGALAWATQVGPGSSLGGIEWGSATDGKRLYVAIANFAHQPYADSTGASGASGSWNALDLASGKLLWRTPDPNGALDLGPLAVANGVVFAPSSASGAKQKNMYALDGATGRIIWSFASGGSVIAGASIAKGNVFWGSGYALGGLPIFSLNNKFYAFSIPGGGD